MCITFHNNILVHKKGISTMLITLILALILRIKMWIWHKQSLGPIRCELNTQECNKLPPLLFFILTKLNICLGSLYLHSNVKCCTHVSDLQSCWGWKRHFPMKHKSEEPLMMRTMGWNRWRLQHSSSKPYHLSYVDRACFIKLVLWLWYGVSKGVPAKKHLLTSQDINIS